MTEKRPRRTFAKDFKENAVMLVVEEGRTKTEVAKNLGINATMLGVWVRAFEASAKNAFPGKGKMNPFDQENKRLKQELRRVSMERDILRKATAYFSQLSK